MSSKPSVYLRRAVVALAIVACVLLPLLLRAGWEAQRELELAEQARGRGEVDAELVHLGRAARWRVPLLGSDEEALERLLAIGAEQEARGVDGLEPALTAYREARRAILATRAWSLPHPELFERANLRLAVLMAEQERILETDLAGGTDPVAYHYALLEKVPGPPAFGGKVAAISFVFWLVCGAGFFLRALDPRGRLRVRPALRWGVALIIFLVLWMVALRFPELFGGT